jgi:hypothetical protein
MSSILNKDTTNLSDATKYDENISSPDSSINNNNERREIINHETPKGRSYSRSESNSNSRLLEVHTNTDSTSDGDGVSTAIATATSQDKTSISTNSAPQNIIEYKTNPSNQSLPRDSIDNDSLGVDNYKKGRFLKSSRSDYGELTNNYNNAGSSKTIHSNSNLTYIEKLRRDKGLFVDTGLFKVYSTGTYEVKSKFYDLNGNKIKHRQLPNVDKISTLFNKNILFTNSRFDNSLFNNRVRHLCNNILPCTTLEVLQSLSKEYSDTKFILNRTNSINQFNNFYSIIEALINTHTEFVDIDPVLTNVITKGKILAKLTINYSDVNGNIKATRYIKLSSFDVRVLHDTGHFINTMKLIKIPSDIPSEVLNELNSMVKNNNCGIKITDYYYMEQSNASRNLMIQLGIPTQILDNNKDLFYPALVIKDEITVEETQIDELKNEVEDTPINKQTLNKSKSLINLAQDFYHKTVHSKPVKKEFIPISLGSNTMVISNDLTDETSLSKPRLDQNKVHLHKAKSFNNLRAKASK